MIRSLVVAALCFWGTLSAADERWMTIPAAPEMPEAARSGSADVNGISMHYAVFGDESDIPVLLIHGGLAHGDVWAGVVSGLMSDHQVIVADTRGHGRSTNDGSAYSYELLSQDYLALLDYLGVDKAHLVGWSDGANIGYSISLTNPDRLASHFAHAGNVTLDGIDPSAETNPVFGTYVGMMAEDYAALSPTPDGFDAFVGGVVEMWNTDKPNGLVAMSAATVPTLVVQSEYDEAILMEHSKAIAETIPGAKLQVLEDVSHFAIFQAPDEYVAAIRAFID